MCGIVGGVWTEQRHAVSASVLTQMMDAMRHRGPDDAGIYESSANSGSGPQAALGFRRLSIIDLAGGHQPLSNEDGRIWIVFNGEIYNYRELRPDLEARGHVFRTNSDTETIVHLYEEYGDEFVRHLRGMFAIAIRDDTRKRLVLARDRLGQKPLFYRHEPGRLLFASELKALLQVPGAPRELDLESLDLFLTYQYVPHPRSILRGYNKLPPGHIAIYEGGELTVREYWHPPYSVDEDTATFADPALAHSEYWSDDEWRTHLRRTLTEAVRLRMRSDVPLGAFLSGGIDSTIITGLMQSLSERPVHTFSIGFPIAAFDERQYAREAAKHLGTDHHEYLVEPAAVDILPKLVWHYDEPFADSSAIPTMYLCEATRRHVTATSCSVDTTATRRCGWRRGSTGCRRRSATCAGGADGSACCAETNSARWRSGQSGFWRPWPNRRRNDICAGWGSLMLTRGGGSTRRRRSHSGTVSTPRGSSPMRIRSVAAAISSRGRPVSIRGRICHATS
jgi:asparagine synthase (glutamine-hydrolysing)